MHVQIIFVGHKTRRGTVPDIYYTIRGAGTTIVLLEREIIT